MIRCQAPVKQRKIITLLKYAPSVAEIVQQSFTGGHINLTEKLPDLNVPIRWPLMGCSLISFNSVQKGKRFSLESFTQIQVNMWGVKDRRWNNVSGKHSNPAATLTQQRRRDESKRQSAVTPHVCGISEKVLKVISCELLVISVTYNCPYIQVSLSEAWSSDWSLHFDERCFIQLWAWLQTDCTLKQSWSWE